MKFFLVLFLAAFSTVNGVILSNFDLDKTVQANLDAKNPGCDPDIHACSDDISG